MGGPINEYREGNIADIVIPTFHMNSDALSRVWPEHNH